MTSSYSIPFPQLRLIEQADRVCQTAGMEIFSSSLPPAQGLRHPWSASAGEIVRRAERQPRSRWARARFSWGRMRPVLILDEAHFISSLDFFFSESEAADPGGDGVAADEEIVPRSRDRAFELSTVLSLDPRIPPRCSIAGEKSSSHCPPTQLLAVSPSFPSFILFRGGLFEQRAGTEFDGAWRREDGIWQPGRPQSCRIVRSVLMFLISSKPRRWIAANHNQILRPKSANSNLFGRGALKSRRCNIKAQAPRGDRGKLN